MVKVNVDSRGEKLPCELYLDGYMKTTLDDLQKYVDKDWDGIGILFGDEGDGKSVAGMGWSLYLDATFDLGKIVFTPEQFDEAVEKAKPNSVILWDEADELTAHWASKMLQALKRRFKTMRDKNLKVLLVTPTIFDIRDKYFIIGRTRFAIHIYAEDFERGYFRFFNKDRKKQLYLKGKKDWDLKASKANFFGKFTNLPPKFPVDYEKYRLKKAEATRVIMNDQKSNAEALKEYKGEVLERLNNKVVRLEGKGWSQKEYGRLLDITQARVSQLLSK